MSSEQVLNEELEKLFNVYRDFDSVIRVEGVKSVLDDLRHFYPRAYELLEDEFERRKRIRELGVLLVNSV